MKPTLVMSAFMAAAVLSTGLVVAQDADVDRSQPKTFVKDSAITTKIKAKLAAEHPGSMKHISVDTDQNGIVWMTGTANNQEEINQAIAIAKNTEGVKMVKADLKVQKDK